MTPNEIIYPALHGSNAWPFASFVGSAIDLHAAGLRPAVTAVVGAVGELQVARSPTTPVPPPRPSGARHGWRHRTRPPATR